MAKVSDDARSKYHQIIQEYTQKIKEIESREKNILAVIQKDPSGAEFKKIRLADENLNVASLYLIQNEISVSLLGIKNEPSLNEARKAIYKVLIYLEEVVTNFIDAPFSEYGDRLSVIESFGFAERNKLVNKIGFTIQSVMDSFGENTKWKWSFVELEGRMASISKNFMNLKTFYSELDPDKEGADIRNNHLNLTKRLLDQAANRYREKYELSTQRFDDFKLAIRYLGALRLICIAVNRPQDAEAVKKKMEVWQQKLDADMKQKDIASRQK